MHILSASTANIRDIEEAVDFEQTPADLVILSAADSDLTCLVRAQSMMSSELPSLRLANLTQLSHNLSVDIYCEKIIAHARLVIVRVIGGVSYWSYGLEQIHSIARENGAKLIVVPGDDKADPHLMSFSTVASIVTNKCWLYLLNGGVDNALNLLKYTASLIGFHSPWKEPSPLLGAGIYWPQLEYPSIVELQKNWDPNGKVALITFYRAHLMAGNLRPIDALIKALEDLNINPLPMYVSSLKDTFSADLIKATASKVKISVILNTTSFAVASLGSKSKDGPFENIDCPVFQIVLSSMDKESWRDSPIGLNARDIAMNIALPEVDGRLISRAISFKKNDEFDPLTQCSVITYEPIVDRILFTADLVANWIKLGSTPKREKRVALILSNYPNKDSRIGNGVGLDTPASAFKLLKELKTHDYLVKNIPSDGQKLIKMLKNGPTNNLTKNRLNSGDASLPVETYKMFFAALPEQIQKGIFEKWGQPGDDPFVSDNKFILPICLFGNVVVGIQPARGYNIDPKETYHDPALVPPHGYMAFYAWLRYSFKSHAVIHLGKHGNLEWLPGKSIALSEICYPEAALGPTPNIYPFIVNDPGEGSQAKRRSGAIIIDHLVPPLTRAESHGPMIELENLIDEYYHALQIDQRRVPLLENEIIELAQQHKIFHDSGINIGEPNDEKLRKLDSYICDLKEMQIRNGLHVLGEIPRASLLDDLLVALIRSPRDDGVSEKKSILRALANDLNLNGFDPLDCSFSEQWIGPKPKLLVEILTECPWWTLGDTIERLELLARELVSHRLNPAEGWYQTRAVLQELEKNIRPSVLASGKQETSNILAALESRFVPPGPSGAPSRGRPDVLPTGRNFYSVDTRAIPTPSAWKLGWKAAGLVVDRYRQEHGDWPKTIALSAWGTANMRTGGDDIAQALAFLGVSPEWEPISGRVIGFKIIPYSALDRPRVDVTFRISGFFRDAFPFQIELIDSAVQQVARLEEPKEANPLAAAFIKEKERMILEGIDEKTSERRASARIFGSQPGAYGAGLQALIDEGIWENSRDFADSYLKWGSFVYGGEMVGVAEQDLFRDRLTKTQIVLHNQDNREHDILDSDDYYQFQGGLSAAVREFSGVQPTIYHGDHSRPYAPKIRTLEEEIGRVVRGRATNPKWIDGVMRHGYKGAFEMAATVDYLFAFAATSRCVADHHFDAIFEAYIENPETLLFLQKANVDALNDIAKRLLEAQDRGLWKPSRNSVTGRLNSILN